MILDCGPRSGRCHSAVRIGVLAEATGPTSGSLRRSREVWSRMRCLGFIHLLSLGFSTLVAAQRPGEVEKVPPYFGVIYLVEGLGEIDPLATADKR